MNFEVFSAIPFAYLWVNSLLESNEGSGDKVDLKDFVVDEDSEGQDLVNSTVPVFVSLSNEVLLSTCNSNFQMHYFDELHVQSDQDWL